MLRNIIVLIFDYVMIRNMTSNIYEREIISIRFVGLSVQVHAEVNEIVCKRLY